MSTRNRFVAVVTPVLLAGVLLGLLMRPTEPTLHPPQTGYPFAGTPGDPSSTSAQFDAPVSRPLRPVRPPTQAEIDAFAEENRARRQRRGKTPVGDTHDATEEEW